MATDLANPTDEHRMLRELVRSWAEETLEPQAEHHDATESFNLDLLRSLGDMGLLGLTAGLDHGGADMDSVASVIVHEELAAVDPGFALAYLAHSLLFVNNVARNGSEDQKTRFLPKMCSGEWIGAMAMSEPDAGTDVLALGTHATQNDNGDWVLNGRKMWITNGCLEDERTPADAVIVYARTGETNGRVALSTFLVEAGMPGYTVGQKIMGKTGMRASNTAELVFQDCIVPAENLIGAAGDSIHHMMRNLEIERLALAAMSLGIARRSLQVMNAYASERHAFGGPIRDLGQIQRHIGESWAEYRAARAYIYDTANQIDLDQASQRLDSDGVKLFASTIGKQIADRAMQVLGGYGYVSEYVVERLWRDAKLLEIGGGTVESHQKNITRDLSRDPDAIMR